METREQESRFGPLFVILAEEHQWEQWAEQFGCSEARLMDAVSYVGFYIPDIRRFLSSPH